MIDFAEIWIAFVLVTKGTGGDVLETDFLNGLKPRIEAACGEAEERNAEGLELDWGASLSAAALGAMASATEGKQFYIAWLKDRYGYNIARLNAAYGVDFTSFSDLAESDFRGVDRKRERVAEDDRLFLADLAAAVQHKLEEMFQACAPGRKVAWKRKRT